MRCSVLFGGSPWVWAPVLGSALALTPGCAGRTPPVPFEIPAPARVLAVGDVHGDLASFRKVLLRAGLVDRGGRWTGGASVLVQTGDILDRGPDARALMDFLMALEEEARLAGGRVVVLMGNHEAMNVTRDFRDVSKETYAAFVDARSADRQRLALERFRRMMPSLDEAQEQAWRDRHPPGSIAYAEAVSRTGTYGRWLRTLPLIVKVGDSLFMHAGLRAWPAGYDLARWNRELTDAVSTFDDLVGRLEAKGVLLPHFTLSEIDAVVTASLDALARQDVLSDEQRVTRRLLQRLADELAGSMLFAESGPLWFRGYAKWPDERLRPTVDATLTGAGVDHIVSAHSVRKDGRIGQRLEGKLWLIDTGMWSEAARSLQASLWELRGGVVSGIYEDGQVERLTDLGSAAVCEPTTTSPRSWLGPDHQDLPFRSDAEVVAFLERAPVVSYEILDCGSTRPWRLTLEQDGIRARAVFRHIRARPQHESRARPEERMFRDHFLGEVAAYRLATLLGIHRIPPAVARTVEGRRGSVQLWLEDVMTEEDRQTRGLEPPDPAAWNRGFWDMRVFDALIHNTDRNRGNMLIDPSWRMWMVDHTRTFSRHTALAEVDQLTHVSKRLLTRLDDLDRRKVAEMLSPYLGSAEIDALWKRRARLLDHFGDLVKRLGADAVLF